MQTSRMHAVSEQIKLNIFQDFHFFSRDLITKDFAMPCKKFFRFNLSFSQG